MIKQNSGSVENVFMPEMTVNDIEISTFEDNVKEWYQKGMPVWQDGDDWYPTGHWCGLTVNDISLSDLLSKLDKKYDLGVFFPDSEGVQQYIKIRITPFFFYVV